MAKQIVVGDRVAYSARFLQSTAQYTGKAPALRGRVMEVNAITPDWTLATVKWDGAAEPMNINVFNLAVVGTAAMCAL